MHRVEEILLQTMSVRRWLAAGAVAVALTAAGTYWAGWRAGQRALAADFEALVRPALAAHASPAAHEAAAVAGARAKAIEADIRAARGQ